MIKVGQTNGRTDIAISRVAFATENTNTKFLKIFKKKIPIKIVGFSPLYHHWGIIVTWQISKSCIHRKLTKKSYNLHHFQNNIHHLGMKTVMRSNHIPVGLLLGGWLVSKN